MKIVGAIPCLNNAKSIGTIVLKARRQVDTAVVIDDGSHDGSGEEARKAGALVVKHNANLGYGAAIRSAIRAAEAENAGVLVTFDGDGQHDPEEIPRVVAPILSGHAHMVLGSRFLGGKNIHIPGYRRFGIKVITFLWNLGSRTKVTDAQSGFRAYSKEVLRRLHLSEKGMSSSVEILEIARRENIAIKEVPISCVYRNSRFNLQLLKHGVGVALAVVKIRLKTLLLKHGEMKNGLSEVEKQTSYVRWK